MSFNPSIRTQLLDNSNTPFRSAYSTKLKQSISFPDSSPHTRQEFKDECDINNIMRQYLTTGEFFHINETAPQYLDCTGEDFRASMDYIAGAFSMFEELPSSVRMQFDNDPAEFLEFCSHEKNRPELAAMGLLSDEAVQRMATPQGKSTSVLLDPTAPLTPAPEASSDNA
ncbi:MAG: internal scaffolding protein [Microviridae sp.]|nr:MAG: internal scaffolding protein [Microviridae sp.]